MDELKINKGVELMLRGAKEEKEEAKPPSKGIAITRFFTLLKRRVYFNFELLWDSKQN